MTESIPIEAIEAVLLARLNILDSEVEEYLDDMRAHMRGIAILKGEPMSDTIPVEAFKAAAKSRGLSDESTDKIIKDAQSWTPPEEHSWAFHRIEDAVRKFGGLTPKEDGIVRAIEQAFADVGEQYVSIQAYDACFGSGQGESSTEIKEMQEWDRINSGKYREPTVGGNTKICEHCGTFHGPLEPCPTTSFGDGSRLCPGCGKVEAACVCKGKE